MKEQEPNGELGDIFSSNEAEKWTEAAEAMGVNPAALGAEDNQVRMAPKKNCKRCCGKGTLTIVLSPSKKKVHMVNSGPLNYRACSKKTPKQSKVVAGFFPGNDLGKTWDTRHPEPAWYKDENKAEFYCKCLRPIG